MGFLCFVGFFAGAAAVAAAALYRVVPLAFAGVDHVVAAVADEGVAAGLAEHRVGLRVADQDVGAEGALHVLVGRREVDVVAAGGGGDPGGVLGEADDEDAGVGADLGEGGGVAAGVA